MKTNLTDVVQQFKGKNVMIIGDAILDVYLEGQSSRMSREAPIPIVEVEKTAPVPGGAANSAKNVTDLGGNVSFISVIGNDEEGGRLIDALSRANIDPKYIVKDTKRKTPTKKRIISNGQIIARFDAGTSNAISRSTQEKLIRRISRLYPKMDAVIISEYGYGVFTKRLRKLIEKLQKNHRKVLVVDTRDFRKHIVKGATAIKPNYKEALTLLGIADTSGYASKSDLIRSQGKNILNITQSKIVAVTMDIEGAYIFKKGQKPFRTYSPPKKDSNTVGAGDTYTSAFALALTTQVDYRLAAEIATKACAVVIEKEGTVSCSYEELLLALNGDDQKAVKTRKQLQKIVESYRKEGKRIVVTNGCFDILHPGHVSYIKKASEFGDILIVGVNSDATVRRLKGPLRPINNQKDRIKVISSLESVDHAIIFKELTAEKLIEAVKPDVYVKGGDYTKESLLETKVVEKYGGRVEIVPYVNGKSTTGIVEKISDMLLKSLVIEEERSISI